MRAIAFLAIIFLSGCSMLSQSEKTFCCPETGFVNKAANIAFHGIKVRINGFSGECKFRKKSVKINLTLPFAAKKGITETSLKEKELPYFIAVLSPEEDILQRKTFFTKITFDKDGNGVSTEEHTLKIPITNPSEAYKYKIAIGFAQISPDKESK